VISRDGLVKITDFGISRARLLVDKAEFTQALQFMGTPDYMAPELRRLMPASLLTDQYALGMTLWKMFAGIEAKQLGRPLIELHPELPPPLSEAIARSIHKEPDKRFPSVRAMRDALYEAMNLPPGKT
jgi:serine/threonine-protein kinase